MMKKLLALGLAAGLLLGTTPAQAVTSGATPAAPAGDHAETVLARAKALFPAATPTARRSAAPATHRSGREATLVLRDLSRALPRLSGADRRAAQAILARPTYGGTPNPFEHAYTVPEATPVCSTTICVHYVDSTDDAATLAQAQRTLTVLTTVWNKEVGTLGYRAPRADTDEVDNGGDGRFDVYLQNLASPSDTSVLYGFCAPDDGSRQVSGYCVLDNDYDPAAYGPAHTPDQNLQVTAAHEFFHAVQFAYDAWEAAWFMEGTAAWMEDEVFDAVNDNLQYLAQSPLRYPDLPIDFTVDNGTDYYAPYGNWIFWRYLSEHARAGLSAQDPSIVRTVWYRAIGASTVRQALVSTLASRHSNLRDAVATFATWNRSPARYYSEGRTYKTAPLLRGGSFVLTKAHPASGTFSVSGGLYHLSSVTVRFDQGRTLPSNRRLRVNVDLGDWAKGSAARVVVRGTSGSLVTRVVPLSRTGVGALTVDFRRSTVASVELAMVNGGTVTNALGARWSARAIR